MIAAIYPNITHPDAKGRPVRYFDIRKLTEGECLRLMDVSEPDIRTLVQSPLLSKSAIYKLAGNSIVVSCLYHIFRNVYLTQPEPSPQPTLFPEPTFRAPLPQTINLVTLCSGYDSQLMALHRIAEEANRTQGGQKHTVNLAAWAEFDPESKRPIDQQPAVIAHNLLFPEFADRNLGDMTKINWQQWKDEKMPSFQEIDIMTYSTPCFVPGTFIHTNHGLKPIEQVTTDDEALTHVDRYMPVTEIIKHDHTDHMVHIRTMMTEGIRCTSNHPFYARKLKRVGHKCIRTFLPPEWIEASNLDKSYYLGYPVNPHSSIPGWFGAEDNRWGHHNHKDEISVHLYAPPFWYIMGRYIGDGWKRSDNAAHDVVICCSERNRDSLLKELETIGQHYTITKERTVTKVHIHSKEWFEFVSRYGYYAHGKRIDRETMNLPNYLLESFLSGYLDADGCFNGKYHQVTTVSRELAYNLMECVAKVHHAPCRIYFCKRPPQTQIEDRTINQRDTYTVAWKTEIGKQDKAFYEDGYIWYPIREIEHYQDHTTVYNLEVLQDHSYVANNAIVHNCQSISNAGKRTGIAKGSGTRSAVLWYTEEAIRVLRPKFLLQENVKALCNKVNRPHFEEWQQVCQALGYTNYWAVLNAKDYGVPQNRERVFMLSVRNDLNLPAYRFPEPIPLTKVVADELQEDVSKDYFLRPEGVIKFLQRNSHEQGDGIIYTITDHFLTDDEIIHLRNNPPSDQDSGSQANPT